MRSVTTELICGRVDSTGIAYEGVCRVQKVASGRYWISAPPGRRILSCAIIGYNFPQWGFVQTADFTGQGVLVLFANQAATVEVDESFMYNLVLAA